MPEIYKAELTVHSVIDNLTDEGLPDGDPEINIFTTEGTIEFNGSHATVSYTEKGEGYVTECTLKDNGDSIALERRGAVECDIRFAEGEICKCIYRVPPYAFDMFVLTSKIRNSITVEGGELQLIYSMNIGGQSKKVRMKIKATMKK